MSTVLVVDDDSQIARFVEINLQLAGFDVVVATDAEAAERLAYESAPDLALIDVMMPKVDGVELCRRLRANPLTAGLPIIMLTAKGLSGDKVAGLTAGADDYIVKPFDTFELIARVRSTLRRSADNRATSPLTGLPGNQRIEQQIADRVAGDDGFGVCYFDLDNFKAFNDRYGFLRGDEVISLLATTLRRAAAAAGEPPPFIGHVGGDDFVAVCAPHQAEPLSRRVVDDFDAAARGLHDADDAERGYVEIADRQGVVRRFPLVSVSVGVATSGPGARGFRDHRQVVEVATEMKKAAKATTGSSIAVDRRGATGDA